VPEDHAGAEGPSTVVVPTLASAALPPAERRVRVRYAPAAGVETLYHPMYKRRNEQGWPAKVRDISADGIGLILCRWFGQGTLLEVELHNASRTAWRQLSVRVRHATPCADGWLVGGAFVEPLNERDLKAFL